MKKSFLAGIVIGCFLAVTILTPLEAATSRLMPVAYNTSTFGGATRNYTSLAVWEDATDIDLVTAAKGEVLVCYPDSASYDQFVSLLGATTNASYFRVIKSALPTSKVFFSYTGTGSAIYVFNLNEDYAGLYDLDATYAIGTANPSIFRVADVTGVKIVGCRGKNSTTGTTVTGVYGLTGAGKSLYVVNCMMAGIKTYGYRFSGAGTGYFYNCASYNAGGFSQSAGTAIAKNCCNSAGFTGTWTTVNCITSASIIYLDPSNYDLHLTGANRLAREQGASLLSDAAFPFNDDYDGQLRPYNASWDIGADEWSGMGERVFSFW